MDVAVGFEDEETATDSALERLVGHMERDRPQAMSMLDMGDRYANLERRSSTFGSACWQKLQVQLAQNERAVVSSDIVSGL